jgi:NTE family protein
MNSASSSPRVGLALGSGASRGWSHIGVIKALLAEGVEPHVVCGTSVGAMIGGSYVAGNLEKLEDWVLGSTRSEVWFTHGGVADAVRASMAMPGLFPAVQNDELWLVDGGLVNPVPVSVCHALGAEVVIAVNLNAGIVGKRNDANQEAASLEDKGVLSNIKQQAKEYSDSIFPSRDKKNEAPGLFHAIGNSINIFQDRITRSRLAGDPADVVLSPKVSHIGMFEFHRAAEAIEAGELCVRRALAEIHALTGK